MKRSTWQRVVAPTITGIIGAAALIGAIVLNVNGEHEATPQRVSASPTIAATPTPVSPTVEPTIVAPEPPVEQGASTNIAGSNILQVSVPAVGIDVGVSGETWPRQTENCQATTECIDPPVPDQAAWYGAVPSMPSTSPVLLFGHTSWSNPEYATFNNLPAVIAGDTIVLTTETGFFTYEVELNALVPYSEVPQSRLIWAQGPEKLVLITCNQTENSGTVVVARLISAAVR